MTLLIVNVCALANRTEKLHIMLVPCHDTMPSFMIFGRVLDLQELKNQVSQSFRPSHDAQIFEFHSHFLHGPINSPKDTHVISQPTLVHWSMCL